MKKYRVKEGVSGVLELTDEQGRTTVFHPDCDVDKALAMLYEFYDLRTVDGVKVKDAFVRDGIDWFPTAVSMLCWHFFWKFIKYRPLIEDALNGDTAFVCVSARRFSVLLDRICESRASCWSGIRKTVKKIYGRLVRLRNRLVVKRQGDILFYRYGTDDFRTNELFQELSARFRVTQVTGLRLKELLRYFFDPEVYIVTAGLPGKDFDVNLPEKTSIVYHQALSYARDIINGHYRSYCAHSRLLKKFFYKLFFGLDDANFVYPILYAAQDAGIRTLALQHGVYMRRHEAYILKNIERYRWYDNVLVWGKYWKEVILKHSDLFSEDFHILAGNKHVYDYTVLPKKGSERTILVPYEFLADTMSVGKYIRQFMAKGFRIYFKPRSDEPVADQLNAYYLGEDREKIRIVEKITPEAMAEIDIIAGTQTTLIFDLLGYQKPVWILDTPFRLLYDMVDDGLARLVTYEDMSRIHEIYQEDMARQISVDPVDINGDRSAAEVIEEYLTRKEGG